MLRFEQLDKSAELPIYEKDRLDLVGPSAVLQLDLNLLNCFHEGYRHLAYLQVKNGFNVKGDLPGRHGSEVDNLYVEGESWLSGSYQPGESINMPIQTE